MAKKSLKRPKQTGIAGHQETSQKHWKAPQPEVVEFNNTIYATCEVTPSPNLPRSQPKIFGQILFKQVFPDGVLEVKVNLRGFPAKDRQERAIDVHRYGDLSQGSVTVGPPYNPNGVDRPSRPGDMGNFASEKGVIRLSLDLPEAKLFGAHSILGRSVVVHEKEGHFGMGSDEESQQICGRRLDRSPGKAVEDAVIIGTSMVRHVCANSDKGKVRTHCFPGARVLDVAAQVPEILNGDERVEAVVLHAGANDIRLRQTEV
ncbi:superoxide dismutase [Cu-Zn] [Pimephales promelas]|nr:superoxide dismutase [Cu-Zn] [Pimephales promelas]